MPRMHDMQMRWRMSTKSGRRLQVTREPRRTLTIANMVHCDHEAVGALTFQAMRDNFRCLCLWSGRQSR